MSQSLVKAAKSLSFINAKKTTTKKGRTGRFFLKSAGASWPASALKNLTDDQAQQLKSGAPLMKASSNQGPVIYGQTRSVNKPDHYGFLAPTPYSMARDLAAGAFRQLLEEGLSTIEVEYFGDIDDELMGLAVGVEMICYDFAQIWPTYKINVPSIKFKAKTKKLNQLLKQASELGSSVNLARFLVDLPANALNPKTYAEIAKGVFAGKGKSQITIWPESRLKNEKMGLHLAVGQGASEGPCMIHICYRHPQAKGKPLAFVGKGITFDSGGLDIKPAAGMRLMKKDMGGSATVMGLAYWVHQAQPKINCDFYLAVAENATGEGSFHPGDIITAKNGLTVEIHNTDAEGRLVMADVLTVATAAKPKMVIDVATLTGAIKYGLGSSTPGLFCNDDNLAEVLMRSAQQKGERAWRMPLVPEERSRLKSDVADVVNCTDGFGGAITAALFLEKFVGDTPWAHFDIYSWVDRGKGPFKKSGGNGQLVQGFAEFVLSQADAK